MWGESRCPWEDLRAMLVGSISLCGEQMKTVLLASPECSAFEDVGKQTPPSHPLSLALREVGTFPLKSFDMKGKAFQLEWEPMCQ